MATRVLLVEDNEIYRTTLELLLDGRDGIAIVGAVADGGEAAAVAAALAPDVVVMDFRLPGLDGAEATRAVRSAAPDTAVLCLTAEATEAERQLVLDAGAVALVEKGQPIDDLVQAIRSANTRGEHE